MNLNSKQEQKFIAVGRYNKIKGFDNLIEAFKIFNQNNKEWKLEIIGEGDERKTLQNLIDKYNLGNYIKLTGQTNNVDQYYSTASFFLMSSRMEGFGVVLLEAMQHKLPILSFDIPIIHEILPQSVPIINQNDFKGYADKMIELIENKNRISDMTNDYDECLEKFYVDNILKEWKKVLI